MPTGPDVIRAFATVAILFISTPTIGQTFDELVVFGDSHSDTGNWSVDQDDPRLNPWPEHYEMGRLTNGPVWVEQFAAQLGLPAPTPSEAGGTNYAWASARTGNGFDSNSFGQFPRLGAQVDEFLERGSPNGNELIVIFIGHNDFGWGRGRNATRPVASIRDEVTSLTEAGGQHFLIPNLHPLGHLPEYSGTLREESLISLTSEFNESLKTELDRLGQALEVAIYQPDFFGLVQSVIEDPGQFGLSNLTEPALADGEVVPNFDEYLYWDGGHFTTKFHGEMANRAMSSVPEPHDSVAVLCGIVMLLIRRYGCVPNSRRSRDRCRFGP